MRSIKLRRCLVALAVAIPAAVGLAGAGSSASADVIICTTVNDVWNNQTGTAKAAVSFPSIAWNNVDCDFRVDESWSNPAVSLLQWTLNACYGPYAFYQSNHRGVTRQLAVDGRYGPNTRGAVEEFQRWYNAVNPAGETDLYVDGYAGPNTRSKMRWVTNALYGARCSNVVKHPPITVTAPPGRRGIPDHAPLCGQNDVNPVYLHGVLVKLRVDRCTGATRAQVDNAPAGANVSIDRTSFRSPDSCNGGDCWISSAEIGANYTNDPRHYFRDDSTRSGSTLYTPYIDGYRYYVRACLLLNGYYQCVNNWYADTDR